MTKKNDDSKNKASIEINKPTTEKADQGSEAAGDSTNVASPPPVNPRQEGEQQQTRAPQPSSWPSAPPTPPAPTRASQASPRGRGSGGGSRGGKRGVANSPATIVAGGGVLVGRGAGACSGAAIFPDAPSGSRPLKRKSEVVAPVGVKPICSVCHRDFCSFKALFGHMRCHPDRQWRGCFPPPVAHAYEEILLAFPEPVAQPEERPRQENLQALAGAGGAANVEAAEGIEQPARVARGLDIDLNEPVEPVIDFAAAETLTKKTRDGSGPIDIDINKIPPSEDDDIA